MTQLSEIEKLKSEIKDLEASRYAHEISAKRWKLVAKNFRDDAQFLQAVLRDIIDRTSGGVRDVSRVLEIRNVAKGGLEAVDSMIGQPRNYHIDDIISRLSNRSGSS